MKTLRFVLGDQLSRSLSSLSGLDTAQDVVLMAEVAQEATYVRHHKKKIVFVLSAMRHFAEALRSEDISVDYVRLDDPENTGSFSSELRRAVDRHKPDRVIVTEPGEYRVLADMETWSSTIDVPITIREDDRFLCSRARFNTWAMGRKQLRMEYFYREMRRETGLLMDGENPVGGQWNFDHDNRKRLPQEVEAPSRAVFPPDEITIDVMELVGGRFEDHFGDLAPFGFAVTRADALRALDHFVADCLPSFGDYQDAMKQGAPLLFHAVLSPYLNVGLLLPLEVCRMAEDAWKEGHAPLNAVEGFVRQVLGWREYVRGLYWLKMPGYKALNALSATRPLPDFYWTGDTDMNCLKQVILDTRANAYAHHIQRLMVMGNFALLAGIDPDAVNDWYMVVYADAFEWVELPNTHGMAIFADGGIMASKPYAASGAYIDRMSDYCRGCRYEVSKKFGSEACPLNYLYWNFLVEKRGKLKDNPRLGMIYRTLDRMSDERVKDIRASSNAFLDAL